MHINAILPHVSRQVRALIALQPFTGARPGEVVGLRPTDFDTSGEIWKVKLDHHKTAHCGRDRVLFFRLDAKRVVKAFMHERPLDKPIFSPKDAAAEPVGRLRNAAPQVNDGHELFPRWKYW